MSSQLALDGMEPAVELTERQSQALALIREHAPIRSEDLGWRLRELRGGRSSGAEFDASNGRKVAEALHAKGLVAYVRREGWVPADRRQAQRASAQLRRDDPLPEGF